MTASSDSRTDSLRRESNPVSRQKENSLTRKLGAYAAIGAGCSTFAATAADADIIYTDLRGGNEILIRTTNSATTGIDVDNDGLFDFTVNFRTNLNQFGTFSTLVDLNAARVPAVNAFLGTSFNIHGASVFNAPNGFAFSHFANYWYTNGALQYHYTQFVPTLSGGQFTFRTTGFGTIRFQDGTGNTRFGWIEFVSGVNLVDGLGVNDVMQITRYAYAIDMPIVAGQTSNAIPEPSAMTSIGLLALGAAGVAERRRRKKNSASSEGSNPGTQ